jgi:hypothetical protein
MVGSVLLVRRISRLDYAGRRPAHLGHGPSRGGEIKRHRCPVRAQDDVVGSDITVKKILCMHHLQRLKEWVHYTIQLLLRRWSAVARQPGFEVLALLEPHHHVGRGICLEHAAEAHDAGMLETSERARLLQEIRSAPFELDADFAPVIKVSTSYHVLVVNPAVPGSVGDGVGLSAEGSTRQAQLLLGRLSEARAPHR